MAKRYIDADKTKRELLENAVRIYDPKNMSTEAAMYIIDEQPTADVVEVRHSRWENISGFDVCNICGTSPAYCEPKPNNPKGYPPYYHNCGAKMDVTDTNVGK